MSNGDIRECTVQLKKDILNTWRLYVGDREITGALRPGFNQQLLNALEAERAYQEHLKKQGTE